MLIARDRELALAEKLLATAEGRYGVVVLDGEAGIGKTTIWRELVRREEERGRRVLACRPAETEAKLGFSAITDLLEGVPDDALAALPDPARRALEVALLRGAPEDEQFGERRVAAALRALLEELAGADPLLVAVDDVQWLDAPSASALAFAIRRLTGSRIGWLLSVRSGKSPSLDVGRLVDPGALARVEVGALTIAALYHVLRERTKRPLTRPAMTRIHSACGGNPLYALEIARELDRQAPEDTSQVPVPDDLRKLIAARVRRLPEATRDALLTCAALSEPTTALVDESELAPAEEEDLVRVGTDGRIVFTHPLYPAAVYASAARARRRELHTSLARRTSDPEERARHLSLASDDPDEEVAAALEAGAVRARSRGAWASGGELLERAARLTPSDDVSETQRRAVAAAEHHLRAGDRPRSRALIEEVLTDPPAGSLRPEALGLLGEITYNDRNFGEAGRRFAEALELADGPGLAGAIELQLSYVHADAGDYATAVEHGRRGLELAEEGGEAGLIAEALATCAITEFALGLGLDWDKVERALGLEDRQRATTHQHRPSAIAGLLTAWVDRFEEGRARLAEIGAWARERGDDGDLGHNLTWRSWLEARNGNSAAAAELADEALVFAELTGSRQWYGFARGQSGYASAHLGRIDETREACEDADRAARESGQGIVAVWVSASTALLELSLGRRRRGPGRVRATRRDASRSMGSASR